MTNLVYNIINELYNYNEYSKECLDDFDFCEDDFIISSNDAKAIECLINKSECCWNEKMIGNAKNIINKYKDGIESILDINLSNVHFIDELNSEGTFKLYFDKNLIKTDLTFINERDNVFDVSYNDEKYIYLKFNYNNIFYITKEYVNKKVILDSKLKEKINLFLNSFDYEKDDIYNFYNDENYNINLLKFQELGTTYGLLNKKVIIGDEMGLGKTVQALSIVSNANAFPCIIVCSKSLKYKWEDECKKINNIEICLYDKKTEIKDINGRKILIMTYEDASKAVSAIELNKSFKSSIFDESHYLKNKKTVRFKSCKRIPSTSEYIIELTGSPILNRVSEILSQIDIIDQVKVFGSNIEFLERYCEREKIYKREDFDNFDYNREKERHNELSQIMKKNFYIRRLKKNVLKELPEKRREFISVDIDNRKEYDRIISEIKRECDFKRKKQLLSKLKKISSKGKIKSIKEQIDGFVENNEKIVVFAYHKEMQKNLLKEFPDALTLFREQTDKERHQAQEEFLNNPDKLIIICSIKVAHAGFDLFSSSKMIFAEMDWTPDINRQCEDRIHRIGQFYPVNIIYIIAKNTIEERILEVNLEKIKIINEVNQEDDGFSSAIMKDSIKNKVLESI